MRSTKIAVSLACLAAAGIGIGISLGIAWLNLSQSADQWALLKPELLKIWIGSVVATAAAIVLPVWLVSRRINRSIKQLAAELVERRVSSSEFPVVACVNRDREYQMLVAEINHLLGDLREYRARLDHYSAKVAHELRGPLTLLQLQLDYEAKRLDPQFLEAMTAQIRRLTEYVDTALYVAKVAAHKIRPVKTRHKIAALVEEISAPYNLLAAGQQRTLSIDLSIESEAELDAKIFGLILHNLFTNAISHGLGEIRLRSHASNGAVTLMVLNRVRAKAHGETGNGMGLRTVGTLAQAHNLTFRSRPVFNFYAAALRIPTLASTEAPVAEISASRAPEEKR
ncbi:MAG TPA: HAMP domain-containing sensor histidine kinase [Chthoniobacterales bacterium]|jgi:signal transduction histidine kinase|nr:HAMP domain-containing sensor histidine kinase [Chthoniobacterales bacterium]